VHVVGSLLGSLELTGTTVEDRAPQGLVQIDQDVVGEVNVHCTGAYRGRLVVSGVVTSSGSIGFWFGLAPAGQVDLGAVEGSVELANIDGPVNIWHGLNGVLTASTLAAELHIDGYSSWEGLNGSVTLRGDIEPSGLLDIVAPGGLTGSVAVDDLLGTVHVAADASGGVHIGGLVELLGIVQIDGDVTLDGHVSVGTYLQGRLEVRGNVDKTTVNHAISVGQDLTGQIRVYGSLEADPNEDDVIQIRGTMPFPGAFTVDFDGFDENDDWDSRAYVVIGHDRYNGNSPAVRVYRVTSCLGDMDNDASVGFSDINPFVAAVSDPAQYAAMKPGLEGSMVYHCDVNEDGTCDFGDINCFVYLVTHQICGPCPGEDDRGEPPSPQELAKQLADNVWPELYDDLVWVVGQAIDWQKTQELREYWTAVYNALTE
jgi:hypothetical protein